MERELILLDSTSGVAFLFPSQKVLYAALRPTSLNLAQPELGAEIGHAISAMDPCRA